LLKKPGFTVVVVLTLALGIGANTTIFSLVHGILLKPLPYLEPDRLVNLFENCRAQNQDFVDLNAPGFVDLRAQNTVFEDMAAYQVRGVDLTGIGVPQRIFAIRASASFFPLLGVNATLGRVFDATEDAFGKNRVAVLSYRAWHDWFGGTSDVLGKGVNLDGNTYSIIGVMPQDFRFANVDAEVWMPLAFEPWELESRGSHNYQGIARFKPGVTLAQARSVMDAITTRISHQFELAKGWGLTLVPMQDQLVGNSRKPLYILLGAVGVVLLIACANVANLLLARALAREREFALRSALGAGRRRILCQLLCENLVLALAGAVVGTLVSFWALTSVIKLGNTVLPRIQDVRLDPTVLVFTAALSVGTALLFGLAPAWLGSTNNLSSILNKVARGSTPGHRQIFRTGFVTVQVALAMVLLVGASLLLHSFARLQAVDLGYQTQHVLTAALSMSDARFPGGETQRKAFLGQIVQRISELPGVESADLVMGLPLAFGGARSEVFVYGRPEPRPDEARAAGYSQVSPGYFQTMGTPLLRGRHFTASDSTNAPFVAIVNEAFVRTFFKGEDPIGQRLRVMDSHRDEPTEIVGVVRDIRQRDMASPAAEEMYFPIAQRCWFDAQIVLRTRTPPTTMIPALRKAVAEVDSAQALYVVRTLESVVEGALAPRRLQMWLLTAFAGTALLLSAIGVYGVMTYCVTERTREIGLRLSLGAQKRQILNLVLRQGVGSILLGIVFGTAAALALTRVLRSLLFDVSTTDSLSFSLVPVILAAAGLIACWLPVNRATKVDPMVALRNE
jgi:putative ABC transport system permease protein